jgi:protein disulfide-isomerase
MKKMLALFVAVVAFAVSANAGEWMTDFAKAKAQAAKEKKAMLVDFAGSDWCGWCIKLEKEVFSKKEFQEFAKKNLILVMVDFPRHKKQSSELKKQNEKLAKEYKIRVFPTVLLFDSSGKLIFQTSYKRGGAAAFVKMLQQELDKLPKNDKK